MRCVLLYVFDVIIIYREVVEIEASIQSMDSMGSSFKLCFSKGTAIAQDFRPRELACFVIFATEILILIITDIYLSCYSKPKDMIPLPSAKIGSLFSSAFVEWACQLVNRILWRTKNWCGSDWFCTCQPVRCRQPGSQRCLPKVDLPFRVCGPDPRRARKGRGIQCNAVQRRFGFCENQAMSG